MPSGKPESLRRPSLLLAPSQNRFPAAARVGPHHDLPLRPRRTIEGNLLHGLSRALHEEVQFDTEKVTSVDWISHPTLTHADTPAKIDVVLVNGDPNPKRPDLPPYGAGEAAIKPSVAAVANAIYDATGVRIRRVPFREKSILAALKAARL